MQFPRRRQMSIPDEDRRRSIAIIRAQMAWWGHPLDHLTDDQIEAGVLAFARAIASTGISSADATSRFRSVVQAYHDGTLA